MRGVAGGRVGLLGTDGRVEAVCFADTGGCGGGLFVESSARLVVGRGNTGSGGELSARGVRDDTGEGSSIGRAVGRGNTWGGLLAESSGRTRAGRGNTGGGLLIESSARGGRGNTAGGSSLRGGRGNNGGRKDFPGGGLDIISSPAVL